MVVGITARPLPSPSTQFWNVLEGRVSDRRSFCNASAASGDHFFNRLFQRVAEKCAAVGEQALAFCLAHSTHPTYPTHLTCTIGPMARYTLVYGVRLIPEGTLKGVEEATLELSDGSTAGLTLHTFDGTIPQLRRSLDRSLDAFFDLLPGAADEDLDTFGD